MSKAKPLSIFVVFILLIICTVPAGAQDQYSGGTGDGWYSILLSTPQPPGEKGTTLPGTPCRDGTAWPHDRGRQAR